MSDAKEIFAAYVLPRSQRGRRPLPGWPRLLANGVALTVLMALWRGLLLWLLILLAHSWWPAIPKISYLAAAGIALLLDLLRPAPQPTPTHTTGGMDD